jgi:radical SAM superfamily enzyme YgiQ (UPF0313 family)
MVEGFEMREKVKVAFVVPSNPNAPNTSSSFGVGCIASYLNSEVPSIEIIVVDEAAGHDITAMLSEFQPDIVGVSASTSTVMGAYKIGDRLRKNNPCILTVIGGVHATNMPEEALTHFDCVVVGEGEIVFARIVQNFLDGKQVKGIIQGEEVTDINTLPMIDYDLFDMEAYKNCYLGFPGLDKKPIITITTSRGCPCHCPFCYNYLRSGKVRYLDAERVSEEVLYLHNKYNVNQFFFADDEFLINTRRLKEIKELFDKKGISGWIKFVCQTRSTTATMSVLEMVKAMGCVCLSVGFESGCERTLNYLKHGMITVADNERAILNCNELGLPVGGNFIYGVFDQTFEEMKESYDWTIRQDLSWIGTAALVPFPATDVWKKGKELGLLPENFDYSRLIITSFAKKTYTLNQTVSLDVFAKFLINTARMTRLYAKRNYVKSRWKFLAFALRRPVFYWACLFHPKQMFNIIFRGKN